MLASKSLVQRRLASAAAAHSSPLVGAVETKVTRLPNGLSVASIETNGPVSSLVLAYRAGSRYQQPDENGLVHHLRNNFGKDSASYLGLKLLWQLGSVGGNVTASHGKDFLAVQTNVIRDGSAVAVSVLGELAKPALKPWDVEEATETLPVDLTVQQPFDVVVDLVHRAAYRNGPLANSVNARPHEVGKISVKQLEAFSASRLVSGEAVLLGVNVEHSDLLGYAQAQNVISEGRGKDAVPSPYLGGDARTVGPSSIAHVVIAGEGAGLKDTKAVAVQRVLAALVGQTAEVKFSGSAGSGVVGATVQKAANQRPVGISAVDVNHSETGLAGVYVVVEGQYAEPVVRAAFDGLKKIASGVETAVFEAAKANAKLNTLLALENPASLALETAADVLVNATVTSPLDFAAEISKVSVEDVKKAAQKIVQKPSVAAYGRVNQVPYVDQL
ncbi:unnamed protein product [Bursaphelenchus xylophilus]|uniref:(pine wood nematode) hypothetical protein n=1 Tax=Bursaphelenchus xylophilus TaxID=6326 RepID=A0A1I7SLA5_BURXY|nr:unnamed protein product [Bursaphelenchus xylophilus]CAG9129447.1 unnamed protein product [Bursaphelenchus xylophilus]